MHAKRGSREEAIIHKISLCETFSCSLSVREKQVVKEMLNIHSQKWCCISINMRDRRLYEKDQIWQIQDMILLLAYYHGLEPWINSNGEVLNLVFLWVGQ